MNILLIGNGGREHAIAWKLSQSKHLSNLYIAPGNPGTSKFGENVKLDILDFPSIIKLCKDKQIDLIVVGPEVPLAEGISDALSEGGFKVFGPSENAARIEASKSFCKSFMEDHHIPTARFFKTSEYSQGAKFINETEFPVVLKASGLCAGKGVIIPESKEEALVSLNEMLVQGKFGTASETVVIEEKLCGPEISLMAFTDGKTVKPMLPVQDHKRLLDGQQGPNTGGMGAFTPVSFCTLQLIDEIVNTVLQPAVDGLRNLGTPFIGVLYAGLMLTDNGLSVLEFNCRFGDPETQVILPMLETDLVEIISSCVDGTLEQTKVTWHNGSAVCVIIASEKYPDTSENGIEIQGLDSVADADIEVFHAGTKFDDDKIVTAGGRVLGVTGWDANLSDAIRKTYRAIDDIYFSGMQYRTDIAQQGLASSAGQKSSYANSGVDIDSGNRSNQLISQSVKSTHNKKVLSNMSSFGGLFDISELKSYEQPILVASTDGVGTKVKLAAQYGSLQSIGMDIVNHCINDILVQGARPLFFLDYYASSKLNPEHFAKVIEGMASACKESDCALIGGETAEMPGVYLENEFDIAGTIVGILEKRDLLPKDNIKPGDVMIGLSSSGAHTNGYSLIRQVFKNIPLHFTYPELGIPLGEALLKPHRSYLKTIEKITNECEIKGLVHVTGGGFYDNIPRVLPADLGAVIYQDQWAVPPLFKLIQTIGGISDSEMYRVFNMGIGMIIIVDQNNADTVQRLIPEKTWKIGEIVKGSNEVFIK